MTKKLWWISVYVMLKFFKEYGGGWALITLTFKIGVLYILIYVCVKTLVLYICTCI